MVGKGAGLRSGANCSCTQKEIVFITADADGHIGTEKTVVQTFNACHPAHKVFGEALLATSRNLAIQAPSRAILASLGPRDHLAIHLERGASLSIDLIGLAGPRRIQREAVAAAGTGQFLGDRGGRGVFHEPAVEAVAGADCAGPAGGQVVALRAALAVGLRGDTEQAAVVAQEAGRPELVVQAGRQPRVRAGPGRLPQVAVTAAVAGTDAPAEKTICGAGQAGFAREVVAALAGVALRR